MNAALAALLLAATFAGSFAATQGIRRYALRHRHLDAPGPRSSHAVPTPKSGGLAIVVAYLAAVSLLFFAGAASAALFMALLGGGAAVAAVGLWDDRAPVSAGIRIAVHFAASGWAVYCAGGVPPLPIGDVSLEMGLAGDLLGVLAGAWLLNLYNFMDGIDGLAASEAVAVLAGACLIIVTGDSGQSPLCLGLLAVATLGFLYWNWPPARIFMGDVGSGFLGFALAVLALKTANSGAISVWSWVILLGVFIVDATVTLLRRMISGERWYLAHRSHAYQRAAVSWCSHRTVTLRVLAIDVVWLLPLAWYVNNHREMGVVVTALALSPLIVVTLAFGAGKGG